MWLSLNYAKRATETVLEQAKLMASELAWA
jgi:hypothetical protein